MSKYKDAVCKGSWALGTACGHCERCDETALFHVEKYEAHGIAFAEELKKAVMQMADKIRRLEKENLRLKKENVELSWDGALNRAEEKIEKYEKALTKISGMAGNPSAEEACRLIIKEVSKTLGDKK